MAMLARREVGMPRTRQNVLDLIGGTPLIELGKIWPKPGALLAKAEFMMPGGSTKDRVALEIISAARRNGSLRPACPVIEMTSGNMGSALAVVCAVLGHQFIAVMSAGNSPERVKMIRGLGADVILVPQVEGSPGHVTGTDLAAVERMTETARLERRAFYVDQFHNPAGTDAHFKTTGPELWEDTDGCIDAFVSCVGTGGTLLGTSRYLKRQSTRIRCYAVEPAGAEVLAGKPVTKPQHLIQGTGYGRVPSHWDPSLVDGSLAITDEEVLDMRDRLSRLEGLYVGYSSAANVAAAVKLMEGGALGQAPIVTTLLCDSGLKY
jgi:cysteine synthase